MVNFVFFRDFGGGFDFFGQGQISKAKAKDTVPRPRSRPAYCKAKAKD